MGALAGLRACLHGGDVVAVHEELCADHAGGGAAVYEALVQHMVCCLDGALWSAQALNAVMCPTPCPTRWEG